MNIMDHVSWKPGIDAPGVMNWLIVASCFGATPILFFNSLKSPGSFRAIWLIIALVSLVSGLNKSLGLQQLASEIGGNILQDIGVYPQRRIMLTIAGSVLIGSVCAGLLKNRSQLGQLSADLKVSLAGTLFLFAFFMGRVLSFHRVDMYVNRTLFGVRIRWYLEFAGVGLIWAGILIRFLRNGFSH